MSNDSFHDAIDNDSKETHASSERPMRIWSPAIPHYTLDERHIDGIVKQFVQKIETGAAEPLDPADDPMYASLEYGMDIRMVDELKDQFECVELRKIDLLLLKECNRLRRETEKLMVVYYQMIQVGEKDEEGRKLLLLLLDYIRGRKVFLERNEEIRERINLMLYNSEKGWNYLKACQAISNKK